MLPEVYCPYCAVSLRERCAHVLAIDRWYRRPDQSPPAAVRAYGWVLSPFEDQALVRLWQLHAGIPPTGLEQLPADLKRLYTVLVDDFPRQDAEYSILEEILRFWKLPMGIVDAWAGSRNTYAAQVWWRYYLSPHPDRARERFQAVLDELVQVFEGRSLP